MKIFKFGGASVKDADSVKNVSMVLKSQGFAKCLLVISAMGKTTNELEKVVELYFKKDNYQTEIEKIKRKHIEIAEGLFPENHAVFAEINLFFDDIDSFLRRNKSPNYNFVYDQVVSCGEMISTKIVSEYLNEIQFTNQWLDARDYVKTDNSYREGVVDWSKTEEFISHLNPEICYVTQGFIGSDDNNFTVTLGREGSDYSAAIFAYCLNAEAMTIWKDVPGVMTGDPRKFKDVSLLSNISYEEAIEMAYYGASVIHPKTLQPLQQKNIPFYVKSFVDPTKEGTKVGASDKNQQEESYILKENQDLLKISTRDFSFIAEDHMSLIFGYLSKYKIKVSLMQNSAISLALCLEDKFNHLEELNEELQKIFKTEAIKNVSLFTVRNAKMDHIDRFYHEKNVLLEQISKNTLQMVTQ
ncbi:aspartate kinase [Chryseobacterium contaminans]|uniref:Aspartokinase n=1 Tax=Chryseobacterium contaminans TaxID=1423959 RepID=A0A1M6ZZV2_9FLAO|nr:aspartate kinase [Chryseobacterium contaminans]OCA80509.1 aspartate kinase [Chryseobacterium contaminans]SHL36068.1 aspartate kinase [Chryseobacterium contaminans]